jgi:hypothetical protein
MATSTQKMLWASSGFQARSTAERAAYRANLKAARDAYWKSPEGRAAQERVAAAHAAWTAAGMPDTQETR